MDTKKILQNWLFRRFFLQKPAENGKNAKNAKNAKKAKNAKMLKC